MTDRIALGIDPGINSCGLAVVRGTPGAYKVLAFCSYLASDVRVFMLPVLGKLVKKYAVTVIGIERYTPYKDKYPGLLESINKVIGAIEMVAEDNDVPVVYCVAREWQGAWKIKPVTKGDPSRVKGQVVRAVKTFTGAAISGNAQHAADAVGIAAFALGRG